MSRPPRAPGGVRFAAWLIGIGAVLNCLGGVFFLVARLDKVAPRPGEPPISHGALQAFGFVLLAIGLFEFVLVYALMSASRGARIITTVLFALGALGSLFGVFAGGPAGFGSWLQLVLSVLIIYGLWGTPNATDFFAKPEPAAPPQSVPPIPPPPTSTL